MLVKGIDDPPHADGILIADDQLILLWLIQAITSSYPPT